MLVLDGDALDGGVWFLIGLEYDLTYEVAVFINVLWFVDLPWDKSCLRSIFCSENDR
jgi:hypothetical protein